MCLRTRPTINKKDQCNWKTLNFLAVLEACNNYKILNDPLRYYTTETYANGRTARDLKSDALVGVGSYSSTSLGSWKSKDWSGQGFYRFDGQIGQNVRVTVLGIKPSQLNDIANDTIQDFL